MSAKTDFLLQKKALEYSRTLLTKLLTYILKNYFVSVTSIVIPTALEITLSLTKSGVPSAP